MAAVTERGTTLVEVLVAAAIFAVLTAALLQFASLTVRLTGVQGDLAEVSQRGRIGVALLHRDIAMAGAGPWHGTSGGTLGGRVPAVRPARMGARLPDPALTFAPDRLSVLFVGDTRAQTTLALDMAAPGAPLVIVAAAPGCPAGGTCGLGAGDRALVLGAAPGEFDLFTVADAGGAVLTPDAPLSRTYPAGSAVVRVTERVYYLDRAARRLMLYDGARTDSVVLDQVRDLRFEYFGIDPAQPDAWTRLGPAELTDGPLLGSPPHAFDADLLRIRRIRVTLAVEPPADVLPAPGSRGARTLTFDVTPRNLGVSR